MDTNLKKRLENQMRIHWAWLKETSHKEASEFVIAILENFENDKSSPRNPKDIPIKDCPFHYTAINAFITMGINVEEPLHTLTEHNMKRLHKVLGMGRKHILYIRQICEFADVHIKTE